MIVWNFKKNYKKKEVDKVLFIRLLGQYGVQNEIVIEIPEGGTYTYFSDKRSIETIDEEGNTYKIYALPSSVTVEISEISREILDYMDLQQFDLNPKEYN